MEDYPVEQGDCLSSIADKKGFFWQTLWEHSRNADLKKKRQDPNVLFPGDIVHIPDKRLKEETVSTGQVHRFRVKNIPAKLSIRLLYDGEPRRSEAYVLELEGKRTTGKTNEDGLIQVSIHPGATEGKLIVGEGERRTEYQLQLGQLDPVKENSGAQARLRNLGFYEGAINGQLDEATSQAITAFQAFVGLPITSALDEATIAKLQLAHERV